MAPWSTINKRGLSAVALPTPSASAAASSMPNPSAVGVPTCQVKPKRTSRKSRKQAPRKRTKQAPKKGTTQVPRKSPKEPTTAKMNLRISKLKEEISKAGGQVPKPSGLSISNDFFSKVSLEGFPSTLSRSHCGYNADEREFIWCAADDWDRELIAVYLGRNEQAIRLELMKIRRRLAAQRLLAQNGASSSVPAVPTSSDLHQGAADSALAVAGPSHLDTAASVDGPSDPDTDSGLDMSFDLTTAGAPTGFSERSVAISPSGNITATPLLPSPGTWRGFSNAFDKDFFGQCALMPEDQRRLSRAEEIHHSLPKGKVVPWRLTSDYERGLTAWQMQDMSRGPPLNILADAAVEQGSSAMSRSAPPTRPGRGIYQHALEVMGVI